MEPKKTDSFKRNTQGRPEESLDDIRKVVEETKEREERIRKQLALLKEQAQLAVDECKDDEEADEGGRDEIRQQLNKYENQLTSVKDTMENILHFTRQTHNEVQRTKDLVSSIHELTPNSGGSFQGSQMEMPDGEDGAEEDLQTPIGASDDDGISKSDTR